VAARPPMVGQLQNVEGSISFYDASSHASTSQSQRNGGAIGVTAIAVHQEERNNELARPPQLRRRERGRHGLSGVGSSPRF